MVVEVATGLVIVTAGEIAAEVNLAVSVVVGKLLGSGAMGGFAVDGSGAVLVKSGKLHPVRIIFVTNPTHRSDFLKRIIYSSFLQKRLKKKWRNSILFLPI